MDKIEKLNKKKLLGIFVLLLTLLYTNCNIKPKERAEFDEQEEIEDRIKSVSPKYTINADVIFGNDIVHNWDYEFLEGDVLIISGKARPFETPITYDGYPRLTIEPFSPNLSISRMTIKLLFSKRYLKEIQNIIIDQKITIKGKIGRRFYSINEWNIDGCYIL